MISSKRKTKEGTVVSNKMEKTVTVVVERVISHPRYRKTVQRKKKYYAHCQDSALIAVGSRVKIQESRPYSKLKRWQVLEIGQQPSEGQ